MKKTIGILVSFLILLNTCLVFSVSAESTKKDWGTMTGPADFSITSEGAEMEAIDGVSFFKYTKEMIDLNDFSCTFTLDPDEWCTGHEGLHQYYYAITLVDKAIHGGSRGFFFLLMPLSSRSLRVEGQILNTGYLLQPTYFEFNVDTTTDLVMHGRILKGKGTDGLDQYELSFDNCEQKYVFDIPVNYQFHLETGGKAFFSMGAGANGHDNQKMIVKKVNGIDMSGKEESASTPTQTADSTTENNTATDVTNAATTAPSGSASLSAQTVLYMIIAVAAIFLIIVAGFVILILLINKKFNILLNKKQ